MSDPRGEDGGRGGQDAGDARDDARTIPVRAGAHSTPQDGSGKSLSEMSGVAGLDPALDVEPRRRIFAEVKGTPGIHFRELQRRLDMPTGQLEHHLLALEAQGLVSAQEERYYKRYYPRDFDARDRGVMDALRQERPRRLVLELLMHPGLSHAELLARFPMSPSTLSFYLDHLLRAGLVERRKDGKSNRYFVVEPERVARAVIAHRRSFLDRLVDNFAEAWITKGV